MISRATLSLAIGLAYLLLPDFAGSQSAGLLWENREPSAPYGQPYAVDAEDNVVVAVGELNTNPEKLNTEDWFVRAYDARTGVTLWEDRLDLSGQQDTAIALSVHADVAYVVGQSFNKAQEVSPTVRAYSLKSGAILWEKHLDKGNGLAVVADGGQLFVGGSRHDKSGRPVGALFALDASTGATLWESDTASTDDPTQNPFRFAFAAGVRIQGERVFVAGQMSTSGTASGLSMYAEAHDRKTGTKLWGHQLPDAQLGPTATIPLAVDGNWLVVGGGQSTTNPDIPWDYRVTTLNALTGALAWSDQVHRQAGGLSAGLGFGAGKLFAYGWDCDDTVSNCHAKLRAYDPQTGVLKWEDRFTGPGGDITIPIPAPALAVHGNQVFLGTGLLNLQGNGDYVWTVRWYDGKDGSVRWQSQTDDGPGSIDGVLGLKILDDRLYAAGVAGRPDGGFDFTVRAYQSDDDGS